MFKKEIKYSYNDVMIQPAVISEISSRSECDPYDWNGMLPIFTAPMTSVVNKENFGLFEKNHIYPILPRNYDFNTRYAYALMGSWAAFSLQEFIDTFCNEENFDEETNTIRALIDIANGHMRKMYDAVKRAKAIYGHKIEVMVGNIANPKTYMECYKAGVDYVRCSIGTGCGCLSSSNVGIHYGVASLINELFIEKSDIYWNNNFLSKTWDEMPKIIADGGVRNYSDIIKALALGADMVMCGGIFSQLIESAGKAFTYDSDNNLVDLTNETQYITEQSGMFIYDNGNEDDVKLYDKIYKRFYGMASRQGQIDTNGAKTKTSEGVEKILSVTTNIHKWSDNMSAYLRSAMSYCDVKNLSDFNPQNVDTILISNNTKNSINQ